MEIATQFRLEGHAALVTGSARGIGRAIALALGQCGAAVAVHGVQASEPLSHTLTEMRAAGARCAAVTGDLGKDDVAPRLISQASAAIGEIDILVINASLQIRKPWHQITLEEARQQMQINFHSSLQLIQAAVPAMRAKKWGRILAIGSVQESRPHPDMAVYAASKSALENLVRNLARQLGADGITINNLAPGVITTDRNTEALSNPDYAEQVRQKIPLARFGAPEDCAGAAVMLCSDAGAYITGQTIYVDGGLKL